MGSKDVVGQSLEALADSLKQTKSEPQWESCCAWVEAYAQQAPEGLPEALEDLQQALVGWPDDLRVSPQRWEEHWYAGAKAPGYLALARRLCLRGPQDRPAHNLQALLASPYLRYLRQLEFDEAELDLAGLESLAASSALGALKRLHLYDSGLEDAGLQALTQTDRLMDLEELALGGWSIGEEGFAALFARDLPYLRAFGLRHVELSSTSLEAMLAWPVCGRLKALSWWENDVAIGAESRLLSAPFASLRKLTLSGLTDAQALTALGKRAHQLESLAVTQCDLATQRLDALFGQTPWTQLRELGLESCNLQDRHLEELLARDWPALERLCLSHNALTKESASRLAQAPLPGRLRQLDFAGNNPEIEGLQALCASAHLPERSRDALQSRLEALEASTAGAIASLREQLSRPATAESWSTLLKQASELQRADMTWFLSTWLPYAQEHLRQWPVQRKRFKVRSPQRIQRMLEEPVFSLVESLDLSAYGLGEDKAERTQRRGALASLLRDDRLNTLKELILPRDYRMDAQIVAMVAQSEALRELQTLELTGGDLGPEGLAPLARSPYLRSLRTLRLGRNFLEPEGAALLFASPIMATIEELVLWLNRLGDDGLRSLVDSPTLTKLTYLDLGDNRLSADGIERLCAAASLASLQSLCLHENQVGPEGAGFLGASPHLANLQMLELFDAGIGDEGLRSLLTSPSLRQLTSLGLGRNGLSHESIALLCYASGMAHLEELFLDERYFEEESAHAIASSSYLSNLRRLHIDMGDIGTHGFAALVHSEHLQLTELALRWNRLGPAAVASLKDAPASTRLIGLELGNNRLGDEGATALASIELPHLKELGLRNNHISDEGAQALANAPWLGQLDLLDLSENTLSREGRDALQRAPNPPRRLL